MLMQEKFLWNPFAQRLGPKARKRTTTDRHLELTLCRSTGSHRSGTSWCSGRRQCRPAAAHSLHRTPIEKGKEKYVNRTLFHSKEVTILACAISFGKWHQQIKHRRRHEYYYIFTSPQAVQRAVRARQPLNRSASSIMHFGVKPQPSSSRSSPWPVDLWCREKNGEKGSVYYIFLLNSKKVVFYMFPPAHNNLNTTKQIKAN